MKNIKKVLTLSLAFISLLSMAACDNAVYHTVIFNTNGGTEISSVKVKHGEKISKPESPTKLGYDFEKWTYKEEEWSFIGYVVTENMVLDASWSTTSFDISYNLEGGINDINNPSSYTIEDSFEFKPAVKCGYTFSYWTNENGEFVSNISAGTTGNIMLFANWSINHYVVALINEDETKGNVSGEGVYVAGENVSVTANAFDGSIFNGWYIDDVFVSPLLTYSFEMPADNISIRAKWMDSFIENGMTYVYFGSYPQTIESEQAIIDILNNQSTNQNGYYEYNGMEYSKIKAYPYGDKYSFSDGFIVEKNEYYYFKVEPILWRVISFGSEREYTLLSKYLLNYRRYAKECCNDYKHSTIRNFLNSDFYEQAFSTEEKNYIFATDVDNSRLTTPFYESTYCCEDTKDNVFLLSYKDYTQESLGFVSDESRLAQATDFSIASGSQITSNSGINCEYWTRSPTKSSDLAETVSSGGSFFSYSVYYSRSVRPAISIRIGKTA